MCFTLPFNFQHFFFLSFKDCLMVGLHTCGDLAPNTLRIFTSKSEVKGVCSVGCCYHLLSEEFENPHKGTKFFMSHDFIYSSKMTALSLSLFFVVDSIVILN